MVAWTNKFDTGRKFLSSSGLRLVFKSGRSTADSNKVGKMSEEREVLIMSVVAGRSLSIDTFRQEFGRKGIEFADLDGHLFDSLFHVFEGDRCETCQR